MILTFADLLDHALAYAGDDSTANGTTKCRRAVQQAYRVLATRHDWSYLHAVGRVTTDAAYSTGTVAFDLTGGTYERMLTLTDGTWPTWAADGYVVVNNVPYQVDQRKSDTIITLTASTSPVADIDAGTSYTIQHDQYALPSDFLVGDEAVVNEIGTILSYSHPRDWAGNRRSNTGPGSPWLFSYIGDTDRPGSMKMVLWPPPDAVYYIDFLYKRKCRPMVYEAVDDGTVSVGAAALTVTGVNTNFKAGMVGSVIRLSADNQTAPTGDMGESPAAFEATITGVTDATTLTIDTSADQDYSGVKYIITDPADIDASVMGDYLYREIEKQFRQVARVEPTKTEPAEYELAFTRAREADARDTGRSAALRKQTRRSGFIHYPINFTGG